MGETVAQLHSCASLCDDDDSIFQSIIEEGCWTSFEHFYSQVSHIIRQIEGIAGGVKVNFHQCKLLTQRCSMIRQWLIMCFNLEKKIKESLYGMLALINVLQRAKNLITDCTFLETVFLDKTAEFADIINGITSCLKLLPKNLFVSKETDEKMLIQEEVSNQAETDRKSLKTHICDKKLLKALDKRNQTKGHLDPEYLIIEHEQVLGSGRLGNVCKGKWFGMAVAVKAFRNRDKSHEIEFQEIGGQDRIHPHVLQTIGYCPKGDITYYVKELMETDLRKIIKPKKDKPKNPIPQIKAIDIMLQIAKAMYWLHEKEVVHGDLKLSNILIKGLIGHANYVVVKVDRFAWMEVRGNLPYMAPEMFYEEVKYTKEMDVYSFGILCAEILTGLQFGQQFKGNQRFQIPELVRSGKRPDLPSGCPRSLHNIIQECWRENPNERPNFSTICSTLQILKAGVYSRCSIFLSSHFPKPLAHKPPSFYKYKDAVDSISDGHVEGINAIQECGHGEYSYLQVVEIITNIQDMVKDAKVNVHQCKLLSRRCTQLNEWLCACSKLEAKIRDSLYGMYKLQNVLHRGMCLLTECRNLETAFIDKTAEFANIFDNINSCLELLNEDAFAINESYGRISNLEVMGQLYEAALQNILEEDIPNAAFEDRYQMPKILRERAWIARFMQVFPSQRCLDFCDNSHLLMQALIVRNERGGVLDPQYLEIEHEQILGQGGYGMVYKGKWFNMPVAVKIFKDGDLTHNNEFEVMGKGAVIHPHLLQMIGHFQRGNVINHVTELLKTDMKRLIEERMAKMYTTPFPLGASIDILLQIAKAMAHLHSLNIVHRDLKLSNILVNIEDEYFTIKIADFGVSRVGFQSEASDLSVRGSIPYMAPELFCEGNPLYRKKVDVYSFGILCGEVLTGKQFGDNYKSHRIPELVKAGKRPALPPSGCPKILKELIQDCWSGDHAQRPDFATICYVLHALQRGFYSHCSRCGHAS